jgi:hypothetical protein
MKWRAIYARPYQVLAVLLALQPHEPDALAGAAAVLLDDAGLERRALHEALAAGSTTTWMRMEIRRAHLIYLKGECLYRRAEEVEEEEEEKAEEEEEEQEEAEEDEIGLNMRERRRRRR